MATREDYLNSLNAKYGSNEDMAANAMLSNGTFAYHFQPEDHGLIGNKARVFAGTTGSVLGDLMTTAGVYSQQAADSLPDDDIGKMVADIAAKELLNNGQYLSNVGADWVGKYAQNEKWADKDLLDRTSNIDYWTDPNGFLTDTMMMAGSAVPMMALAAAAPEAGILRFAGGLLGKGAQAIAPKALQRFGFNEVFPMAVADATGARAVQKATSNAMLKANKALTSDAAATMERWGLSTGPATAAMNAGEIYADLKAQGKSNDEIANTMSDLMAEELPWDVLTGALPGLALSGKLGRVFAGKNPSRFRQFAQNVGINAPVDVASEYFDESNQTRLQNKYSGKEYGTWTDPTQEEKAAGAAAAAPSIFFGLGGGARNLIRGNGKNGNAVMNRVNKILGRNNETTIPANDILTSKEYQEQQARLNNALIQNLQQNNPAMGNTPKSNAPQGTPVSSNAVESAVAPFLGVRMDNGENGCVEAVTKIGAQMGSPFLKEQLSKGVVSVPTLVKNAGDRVIPFDASKLEAGDIIVYGDDDHVVMYDGKGGYVGNSSSQQKVVHGSDYNSMDDLQPTKIIKSDTVGGGAPASTGGVDISNRPGGHVAQLISERTGIPADWIWAQMAHETGNFNSDLAREDHNYGGIKETREGHQGVGELGYRHFDSDEEYADYAAKNLNAYAENGIKDAKTIEEFAKALKDGGYYEDSLENYTNGLKNALGGDSSVKSGNMSAANAVGQMDDSAAVSLMDDFIGDVVTGGQLSQEAIAALTDTNGHFVNNAENRAALLDNNEDLFRQYLSDIVSNSDNETKRNNAKLLLDTMKASQRQSDNIKKANSGIVNEIINNAGSKNQNIKGFYNDFIQDRISSIDDANEINELSSMLNVKGKFQNTPENRQALAQKYKNEIADYYNNVYGPRHEANAQQEPVQAPTQPVQQPQQAQVPTIQNNTPMAQQAQEQQQEQVNYQAMGTRLLEMMKERSIPHNAENLALALNSGNNELQLRALRHMYNELANNGMDTNELNNELTKANTPLLEEGGITDETNQSKNSNAETTTATEGINTKNQVQNSEPEQTEKTGEVKEHTEKEIKEAAKKARKDIRNVVNKAKENFRPSLASPNSDVIARREIDAIVEKFFAEYPEAKNTKVGKSIIEAKENALYDLNNYFDEKAAEVEKQSFYEAAMDAHEDEKLADVLDKYNNGLATNIEVAEAIESFKQYYGIRMSDHRTAVLAKIRRSALNNEKINDDVISEFKGARSVRVDNRTSNPIHVTPEPGLSYEQSYDKAIKAREEEERRAFLAEDEEQPATETAPAPQQEEPAQNEGEKSELFGDNVVNQDAVSKLSDDEKKLVNDIFEGRGDKYNIKPNTPATNESETDTNVGGKTEPQESHFETGTFTHTKTGKELPEAKFVDREERGDFLKCKKLAKQYAGWYSNYSKSFLFETEAGRDAFIKAADEDVFGQEPQEAPASEAPKETPKQENSEKLQKMFAKGKEQLEANINTFRIDENPTSKFLEPFSGKDIEDVKEKMHNMVDTLINSVDANDSINASEKETLKKEFYNFADPLMEKRLEDIEKEAKQEKQQREKDAEKERQKAEEQKRFETMSDYNGFKADASPMEKGKIRKTLEKDINYKGKIYTRKAWIEKLIADNENPKIGVKQVGNKTEYRFYNDNDTFVDLSKTEYDYAKYLIDKQNKANTATTEETSKVEEKPVKEPAKSKRDFIRDHVIVGTVPTEKASEKKTETEDNSIFGSVEDADREMFEALGISPEDVEKEEISFTNEFGDTTDEEIDALKNELLKELSKLSANPVFNPRIYSLGLQLGGKYIQKGYRTFKKWLDKMKSDFGQQIEPWAPAIWETLRTYPKGEQFDPKQAMAVSRAIGARYERGMTDLKAIQDDITKNMSASAKKTVAPLIEASYNGIKKYFDMKEAENNGNAGTKDAGMVRDTLQGHSEEPESTGTEAGGELEVPASGRISEGGNEGETVSGLTPTQEADAKASEIPGHNFTIDVDKTSTVKPQTRADRNIKAIRLVRELKNDNRKATPQEQATLADYTGWGGLIDAFTYKEGWEKQREAIKALVSEGIITEHEKEKMDKTTKDAYYTSPKIVAEIWKAIRRLGFKGGRVLEPSMGTGNFFGAMPEDMRSNSTLMGVEIDPLTSEIATQLYQKANIKNTGFEKITGMDDFFDLVISNVPFDNHQVKDKKYDRFHYLIHNYFFAKSMDMVRPGGLVCFITGQGTMKAGSDAALLRKMLATQADLITAIKLPDTAFEGANTSVTSDLIILRKRDNKMKDKNAGELWEDVESIPITTKNGSVNGEINTFYKKHKDNMIGKLDVDWRGNVVLRGKGYNIVDRMEKIINSLPENIYKEENAGKPQPSDSLVMKTGFTESQKLEGALSLIDGKVYMMSDYAPVELKGAKGETAKAYIKVRNALRSLLEAEIKPNEQESVVEHLRKELNKAYDAFKKKYGNLNDNKNKKMFVSDPDAGMVLALEVEDENHKIVKAKIFEQRSVAPRANIEHVSTPKDALTASLTMKGRVDLDYMSKIYGKPKDEIVQMLDGVIFNDPKEGYVTAAEYLSGNVREKLEHAEEMAKTDASFKKNVEALKEVQPVDLIPEEIHATLGATWIPESDVQDFVDAILKEDLHSYRPDIKVHYDRNLHRWIVEGKGGNALNGQMTYATENRSFINILDYALNNSNSIIKAEKDSDGVITPAAAQKAADENKALQQKIADLKARFSMWIWEDKDRSTRLVNYYNRYYNNNVIQVYDGSHLTFDGMNKTIELWPHQKNVIWRTMQSANTLIAHCVGAGKTFEMIAAAMEMKRIGLCKKPIFTVPRNVVSQFASDFQRLYPMAKVLVIDSNKLPAIPQKVNKIWLAEYNKGARGKEFNKHKRDPLYGGNGKQVDMVYPNPEAAQKSIAQRNKILAQIRYGDWDGIVIGHKPFANFALTPDTVEVFIDEELAPLRRALREAESSREPDKRLIKRLKEAIAKLEVRLERATDQDKKAVGMYFEDLGIDQLFVDEADMFKNLEMTTRLNRIAGVSAGGSERAFDMYMKTKYLTRLNNGRGVVFATGTPISNTLNELYNMERYLMGDILENEYDIHTFDEWVDAFGEVITRVERDPSGEGYRDVNRIKFANLPEVVKMIRRIMDVVTVDDLKASGKEIKLPKLKNGKKTVVAVEPSKAQDEYIHGNQPGGIKARVKWVRDNPKLAALGGEYDNMLRITNDLRKASLDMRLVKPSLPASTENGRARAVASEAYEKYKESNDIKGTQIIFCDMSTPKTGPAITTEDKELEKQDISMYEEIRDELVKLGVPKKEIAFIHDAKTEEQIEDLFDTFNRGDVRFLIGSTEKMGAGSNIQKRTVALHHVTCPWRPRDIEQREGRIIRQGNINDEVEIFEYVTKDTYDANMWEKIKIKANMISQAMTDDLSVRELDEFSEGAASAREVEAICDKNPYLAKKAAIEDELDKLKGAKRDFVNTKKKQLRILEETPALMEAADKAASRAEKDVAEKKDVTGKNFSIKIGNKHYTDRKLANDAIVNALMEVVDGKAKTIAEIGGFRVNAFRVQGYTTSTGRNANSIALQVVRNGAYDVNMGVDGNYINAITRTIIYKPNSVATEQRALANAYQRELEGAKKRSEAVFPHEQELADLEAKLREVEKQVVEYSAKLKEEQEQQIVNEAELGMVTDPETGEVIESKPSFSVSVKKEESQIEAVRKQYEGTDQWLKAPNGKPTNLTEQQWLQVRTPNFKNWFGDWENDPETASKVVDENGEPLVVWHENPKAKLDFEHLLKTGKYKYDVPFDVFRTDNKTGKVENGAFFHRYATGAYGDAVPFFLNVKKPLLTEKSMSGTFFEKSLEAGYDGAIRKNVGMATKDNPEYVVFHPNQIKSATDNSGAFSKDNNNIKLSVTEQADQRSNEEIKEDILSTLPKSAKVEDHGDTMTIHLPNDVTVDVEIVDNVTATDEEAAQARKSHGVGKDVNITINGKFKVTNVKRALISLARNGKKGTAYHEITHLAYALALSKEQKRALDIAYGEKARAAGKDIEEYVADKMRDDAVFKNNLPKGLKKVYEAINDMIDKLKRAILGQDMSAYSVMRDIETGRVFEGEGTGGKVGKNYSSISENSVDKSEKADDNVGKKIEFEGDTPVAQELFDTYLNDGVKQSTREIVSQQITDNITDFDKLSDPVEMDKAMAKLPIFRKYRVWFNSDEVQSNEDYKNRLATRYEYARRCFLYDERIPNGIVRQADGLHNQEGISGVAAKGVSEHERAGEGTTNERVRATVVPTQGEYKNIKEHFNSLIEKHSNKGAFSIGKTQFSISPAQEQAPQSFLEKAFNKFAKNSNIKGDKIIVDQQDKDGEKEEVNLKNYIFSSPSRIAEKVGAFKYFYTIGKRAMDVLTQKRTDFERKLNKAFDLVENEEDYKTLNDLLISGDVQGKEWTKAELIADGVKENVAEAYTQIRHLMEKAYKMVNEARRRPQIHTINNASEKQIQDLRDNDFVDILNIKEDDKGHKKVTYKEYANWERTYTVNKEALRKYDDDPAIQVLDIKQEGDDSFTVTVRESIPPVNKLTGYIPHFFHNYMVRIVDKDGGYVDTIDSGRTEREAVQKAEAWLKENKLEDGQTIHISPKIADFTSLGMDEGQYAAVMGDKDYYRMMNNIAKQNDMTFQEAKEMLNGSVRQKNRHRFFGNLMQRKGVNGYEKNMGYILRHYFNSASRYYAMETEFKPKAINMYERLYGDFDKEAPNTTADYTRDYINDINGNPTTLEKAINNALNKSSIFRKFVASNFGDRAALQMANNITSATSYLCLGCLNASSALLNLTQLINTAAYLNDFEALGKGLAKGFHHKYNLGDLRILHETNVLNDIGLDSGSGYDMNRMGAKNLLGKLNKGGMVLFKKTEAYCRCATVLAAYESAIKKGKSHNEAIEYAKEINRKSNFDYGVADAPNVFRRGSILSQLLLQFKKYGIKELEVMCDMLPWNEATNGKQKAIFWGLMLLACGLLQWPGEDFLDNVFFDGKLKLKAKAWMMEAAGDSPVGKALVKAAMYGLAAPTTGVDISSRAGLADVIPSRGRDIGGPSITRTVSLVSDLFQGKLADAIRDVSPGLYNQYAAWIAGQSTGTRGRVNNYYDSWYDKALKAIGFKSVDESIDSDIQRITSIRKKEATEEKQRAIDDYIEDPSTENYRRLVELGIKAKTVQEERKKKKMDRLERIQSGMSKNDKKGNSGLIKFAE